MSYPMRFVTSFISGCLLAALAVPVQAAKPATTEAAPATPAAAQDSPLPPDLAAAWQRRLSDLRQRGDSRSLLMATQVLQALQTLRPWPAEVHTQALALCQQAMQQQPVELLAYWLALFGCGAANGQALFDPADHPPPNPAAATGGRA